MLCEGRSQLAEATLAKALLPGTGSRWEAGVAGQARRPNPLHQFLHIQACSAFTHFQVPPCRSDPWLHQVPDHQLPEGWDQPEDHQESEDQPSQPWPDDEAAPGA